MNIMCEIPSVYGCDQPKARKDHQCYECLGVIAKGENYFKHHGVWDGTGGTFKVCSDCETLRSEADEGIQCSEFKTPFGYLWESVFENGDATLIKKFMGIKRKRGGRIKDWMLEREEDVTNANAEPKTPNSEPKR